MVAHALAEGHSVRALARDPSRLAEVQRLHVVAGDARDRDAVVEVIRGQEAVLCALGGRPWRPAERVCATAIENIIPAMSEHRVRRIVVISTFGAGETRREVGWKARLFLFGLLLRSEVRDKEAMEERLLASALDWTIARVGLLTDGLPTDGFRAADDGSIRGMGRIPRADVARFMVDAAVRGLWLHRCPVLVC
jgi:putative NADH-flavin reductase